MTTVTATPGDLAKAGQAIFEERVRQHADADPKFRHPMMYATYKWEKLPPIEQVYYMDMAKVALVSFGVTVPFTPEVEHMT